MAQTKTTEDLTTYYTHVQTNGLLRSPEQARRFSKAVLWTLALNLGGGARKSLAKTLPDELAAQLKRPFWLLHFRDKTKTRQEFLKEVAKRSGNTDAQFARYPTQAVFAELKAMAGQDVSDKITDSLAPEISTLWEQS